MAVKTEHVSPWGLTPRQAEVMDALIEHGSNKLVARALGMTVQNVECHITRANKKLGGGSRLARAVAWDRWRRSAVEGAPK